MAFEELKPDSFTTYIPLQIYGWDDSCIKDQMTNFELFRCNCNILIELPMRIILPKTA